MRTSVQPATSAFPAPPPARGAAGAGSVEGSDGARRGESPLLLVGRELQPGALRAIRTAGPPLVVAGGKL